MAWAPHREWGSALSRLMEELRQIISAIADFEPVRLLTPRNLLAQAKAEMPRHNVEVIKAPVDDIWMRDVAPMYITNGRRSIPVDLNFNGWVRRTYAHRGQETGWQVRHGISLARE
jgi:agmatine deiminase